MKRVNTISEAAKLIRELIRDINSTYYFILEVDKKQYQIRVSDHSARAANNVNHDYDNFVSFVSEKNVQDCNMSNEWILDEDGDFSEEFIDIEECLDWQIY